MRRTAEEIEQMKAQVLALLGSQSWATRKEISAAAGITSPAIYRRVISELRSEKKIISEGYKALTHYALSAASAGEKDEKTSKRGAPAKKKAAAKKDSAKKDSAQKGGKHNRKDKKKDKKKKKKEKKRAGKKGKKEKKTSKKKKV